MCPRGTPVPFPRTHTRAVPTALALLHLRRRNYGKRKHRRRRRVPPPNTAAAPPPPLEVDAAAVSAEGAQAARQAVDEGWLSECRERLV